MSTGPEANMKIIEGPFGRYLFLTDGSRIYDLPSDYPTDRTAIALLEEELAPLAAQRIDGTPLPTPAIQTLSLIVARACNMSCSYCYADEGRFGGREGIMSFDIARTAIDRLIDEARPKSTVTIGFMGGEPFLARELIHRVIEYSVDRAVLKGKKARFSLTTNGTLLTDSDIRLLASHDVHVAISIDGPKSLNDSIRPMKNGESSHDKAAETLRRFCHLGRPRHLAARVTITPRSVSIESIVEYLIQMGFDEVGVSPVTVSSDPRDCFDHTSWERLTERMIICGERTLTAIIERRRYPFGNFETAMHELHRGSHRPYPCGAGAAYVSIDANGQYFACHRTIGDANFALGNISLGPDAAARSRLLAERHVDKQDPCRSCWARYLCGGGCYHEVDKTGRSACDHIRAWLTFCISAYVRLLKEAPGYLEDPEQWFLDSHRQTVLGVHHGEN